MEDKVKYVRFSLLNLRKPYEDRDDYALLTWGIRKGFPRITVWTNNKRPDGVKVDMGTVITAPFDYVSFTMFRHYFKNIINNVEPDVKKYTIECFNVKFVDNKKTDEIYIQARVTVGRDKNNVIYLAVVSEGKPKIKFDLLPNPTWFKFYAGEKNLLEDKGRLSTEYALAYLEVMDKLYANTMVEEMTDISMLDAPAGSTTGKLKPGVSSNWNNNKFVKKTEEKIQKPQTQQFQPQTPQAPQVQSSKPVEQKIENPSANNVTVQNAPEVKVEEPNEVTLEQNKPVESTVNNTTVDNTDIDDLI
ncbi:hypothetical protein ACVWU4_000958 [Campylobacter coli]